VTLRNLPKSLIVLSTLWIVTGIVGVVELVDFLRGRTPNLSLGAVGLLLGPGLLYRLPLARICALALSWLAFVVSGLIFLTSLLNVLTGGWLGLLLAALVFGTTYWQYHVLTRVDIRQLFATPRHGAEAPASSNGAV